MKLIKDLFLALLNATVLLILMTLIAGIILTRQVSELEQQLHDDLAPQAARLERIAEGIEAIEADLATAGPGSDLAALSADVAALRADLAAATAQFDTARNITAQGVLAAIGGMMSRMMAAEAPEPGPLP